MKKKVRKRNYNLTLDETSATQKNTPLRSRVRHEKTFTKGKARGLDMQ